MATIPTPNEAKTSDDSTLINHIVGMWARTTPVLSAILTKFVSETGLKSLMSDSATLDDSNKIASSKAVKNANRRYVAENYTDGISTTPAAGSIALGRGGKWVINGDGHLTTTSTDLSGENLHITCADITTDQDSTVESNFGAINATGKIESQGTVKGLKLEAGASGITSSGHINAGNKQVRGANISKFTAKFLKESSAFSLEKEFSESGFTFSFPSATEIRIYHPSVSLGNLAVLSAIKTDGTAISSIGFLVIPTQDGYLRLHLETSSWPVGSTLSFSFIY